MSDQTLQRASALQEMGRHPEAIRLLGDALAGDPDDRRLLAALAVSLEGADRHEELLQVSRRLIALEPDNAGGYLFAASAHSSLEQLDDAVAAADQAVRLSPSNPGSHRMYAWTASALVWKQSFGAWSGIVTHERGVLPLQAAQRAVELGPDDADNHACLGTIAMRHGRRRLARDAFEHALRLEPDHGLAHHNLGVLNRASLRLSSAADHLVVSASDPGATGRATSVRGLVDWWAGITALGSLYLWRVVNVDGSLDQTLGRVAAAVILAVLAMWVLVPMVRSSSHTRRVVRRVVTSSRLLTAWAVSQPVGWLLAAACLLTPASSATHLLLVRLATVALVVALVVSVWHAVAGWFARNPRSEARG